MEVNAREGRGGAGDEGSASFNDLLERSTRGVSCEQTRTMLSVACCWFSAEVSVDWRPVGGGSGCIRVGVEG